MSERIAYVDAFSGASGDMLLGAMLDAGLDLEELRAAIAALGLPGVTLRAQRVTRRGITGTKLDVLDESDERPARHLPAIRRIVQGAGLPEEVAERSLAVFQAIAVAEAGVHGTTVEDVHFHEIGAVDSLVDVVGFCWGLHRLGITALYASPLPLGSGAIRTEHGLLPVPAPATLAILAAASAPTVPSSARGELLTPTGAALLAACATFGQPPMVVERVGYGFGTKEFPWANMLRLWIGQALDTGWTPGSAGATQEHTGALAHPHAHDEAHDHPHSHAHDDAHAHPHAHGHEHAPDHVHDEDAHGHGHDHPHDLPHQE